MKFIGKIKSKLGFCVGKKCLRRAKYEIEIPLVNYKAGICEHCLKKLTRIEDLKLSEIEVEERKDD